MTVEGSRSFRQALLSGLAWGAGVFLVTLVCRLRYWYLMDPDSYYHLAVARLFARSGGYVAQLPWTRFSVFAEHFGDKEILFHWILMPFASAADPLVGGKIALCLLNAVQAGLLGFLGVRWAGRLGLLLPLVVAASSHTFLFRAELLRPHNLSLALLLLAAYLMERRRFLAVGVLAVFYALAYTAFHTLLILSLAVFVVSWLFERERPWRLPLFTALGLGLGLLVHPGFPDNLRTWYLQNVTFYTVRETAIVGSEMRRWDLVGFLTGNLSGILIAVVALGLSFPWKPRTPMPSSERTAMVFAGAFAALSLMASRFVEYAVPFGVLYLFLLYQRLCAADPPFWRSRELRLMRNAVWTALLAMTLVHNAVILKDAIGMMRTRVFYERSSFEAFARVLPDGAKVAASWDDTAYYVFAAPQARYLNVLDPVFMVVRNPEANRQMEDLLFDPQAVEVSRAIATVLDSDYLAFNAVKFADLGRRADADPALRKIFDDGVHRAYQVDRSLL